MATPARTFTDLVLSQWRDPSSLGKATLGVSGGDLTIADVAAVSRHLAHVELTSGSIDAIETCSKIIPEKVAQGEIIYGVNTGFGGSAEICRRIAAARSRAGSEAGAPSCDPLASHIRSIHEGQRHARISHQVARDDRSPLGRRRAGVLRRCSGNCGSSWITWLAVPNPAATSPRGWRSSG